MERLRARHSRFRFWQACALLVVVGCGGTTTTTTTAATTTVSPSTTVTTSTTTTTSTPLTTTTTAAPITIGTMFFQIVDDPGPGEVDISYPHLVHPDSTVAARVNGQIDAAIRDLIDNFQAGVANDSAAGTSTLTIQAAPELLNDAVFSVSGITADFYADTGTGSTGRVGWMFTLETGTLLTARDLFIGGDLERLAESARDHLVDDVLGDESSIVAPDGLLPDLANFDAVWLTPTGVAVGFDQFQVAGPDAGNPAVLIPFAELQDVLDATGVLAPLQSGATLPEL